MMDDRPMETELVSVCQRLSTLRVNADTNGTPEHVESGIEEAMGSVSLDADEDRVVAGNQEKDPWKIARKYQIELCKKALEENVVVYLGTGTGKTHIAILLIYEMRHLIKKPQNNICIFLAPTVALVQQQARLIQDSLDLKVGICCGNSTHLKSHSDWEKEVAKYEIFVMTPQIMLHSLSHSFIKIECIALLIFDECHYAQLGSNHPYAEIMKIFYKVDAMKLPRIFGMTASPKFGKGGSIDGLETLLRAKVYSVEDMKELEKVVNCPKIKIYYYCSSPNGIYIRKLEEIKHQYVSEFRADSFDQKILKNAKKLLLGLHSNLLICLESLGLWGALQASYNFIRHGYDLESNMPVDKEKASDGLCNKYLQEASKLLASDCTWDGNEVGLCNVEVLKEPFFSRKVLKLVGILSGYRSQPNPKCIIFVDRIVTALSLSHMVQNLKHLSSWKCGYLVGIHSGFMSRKNTNDVLEKFRDGELNLLVATKVAEEGLDIQTCCLVIRYDLPNTVASFIQSRGRARMALSEYAFLVDRTNPQEQELIEKFKRDESLMNEEISSRKYNVPMVNFEEKTYKVESTGATISSVSSVSLLHHYCSKLPHDEYFNPRPEFFYCEDGDETLCTIILPANAPLHQVVGAPQCSREEAKKDASLEACKALHQIGALTDYLLPEEDDKIEESIIDMLDSSSCNDDYRAELHEMFVPATIRQPWKYIGNSTCLSSYFFKICPYPEDRTYCKFGLFLMEPLPEEAGKIKLDLCLMHGRMVKTELVPSGTLSFDEDQINAAEAFQKICLGVIFDRHAFMPEYVPLESNDVHEPSTSTFYLLLPVIQHERHISVDWKLVKKFISSPIFRQPGSGDGGTSQITGSLHLANGRRSVEDVVGSLIFVPGKNVYFFVADVLEDKSGYSLYCNSKTHVRHYAEDLGIHLAHPDQPLLKAKQVFVLDNLLRKKKHTEKLKEKVEHFVELPPEICQLKVIGFSKEVGSTLSLLPSVMHRLESFLVAFELKNKLVDSFPEAKYVTVDHVLEAITTESCCEQFSLERLETLGDSFLKLAVSTHLFLKHDVLDEGHLTRKRSNLINNLNLHKLAKKKNLQVYIRDQSLDANQFFALGHRCPITCNKETEGSIHPHPHGKEHGRSSEKRCNKCHHWLYHKTVADVVEALTGAFVIDGGIKAATAFLNWIGIDVEFSRIQLESIYSASKAFLSLSSKIDTNTLEDMMRYRFVHKGLLIQAFVHPSFNRHSGGCYQRLEFLGDAVLDYLITSYLYSTFPTLKPGQLTDLRSQCVNNIAFADAAARLSFQNFIICNSAVLRESLTKYVNSALSSTESEHVEGVPCPKALGDLVESCMGALYLDTGYDLKHAWETMHILLDPVINYAKLQLNPIREIIELCQSYNWELRFSSSSRKGEVTTEAKVDEINMSASATHTSVRASKRLAASELTNLLKEKGYKSNTKSLKDVVGKAKRAEPVLIGHDETPTNGASKSEAPATFHGDCSQKASPRDEDPTHIPDNNAIPIRQSPSKDRLLGSCRKQEAPSNSSKSDASAEDLNKGCDSHSPVKGGSGPNTSAKSRLFEICAANYWKPPVFECWKETGPGHLKEFIFRITFDIEEAMHESIEAYGEPRNKKKDAAEHAAEGALWYLKQRGYT